jgi:uncharacterized cupin superfamily protein
LRVGDCAGFKAAERDGHCFQNRTSMHADLLIVGSRSDDDHCEYSDIDMMLTAGRYSGKGSFQHKDGSPY